MSQFGQRHASRSHARFNERLEKGGREAPDLHTDEPLLKE